MKYREWTPEEVQILKSLHGKIPVPQIAKKLGRTYKSVGQKILNLRNSESIPQATDQPEKPWLRQVLDEAKAASTEASDVDYWKKRAQDAERELLKSSAERTATSILVEQVKDLAPLSYSAVPAVGPHWLRPAGESSAQSAVLMLSDTHVGAKVNAGQTLNFGEYNFDTFLRRLKRLEQSTVSILSDHTTTKIEELVVPMLGDMIDGSLAHSAECGQVNPLFNQFYGASHAIAQFIRNLSALVPAIRIYTCVGNHPRWGTQKKMPTKNRFSNLDQFLYAHVQALVRDIPTIKFELNTQPLAEFKVQGFTFLAAHGDHLRGGDAALGVPTHAIGRNVSAAAQIRLKTQRPGVNYYLLGHLHRPIELPHSAGDIIVNGGFPGIDEFGMMSNFSACDPIQRLFFVHPKHGVAASYKLNLKYAATDGPRPYDIPPGFDCV